MQYSLFNKKLEEISRSDLDELISKEICESWYVEYKRSIPKTKSGKIDSLKISKSISSFANTKGGWIFWGIECNTNIPTQISGIEIQEFRNFEDHIARIITSNIFPTPIYHFKQVIIEAARIVFIIRVEESPTPPYITSQGIIYQRENNESNPIKDRYILEKLNEKAQDYYNSIEAFSQFKLGQTIGQSDSNESYLELYLFPLPFDHFTFDNFYKTDFFQKTAARFYQFMEFKFDIDNKLFSIPLNLRFNSIYSSERSMIIRPLNEENLIYKSTTVELFDNGNLKFLTPLYEFDAKSIPIFYQDSNVMNYLLDKYSPYETVEQYIRLSNSFTPITGRKETDFVRHIRFIDGTDLIFRILIMVSKFKAVLEDNNFDLSTKIGFRAKVRNAWRKFVFFDDEDFLEKIKIYNIPLCPKNMIEIPTFDNGNCYVIDFAEDYSFFTISKFILEGIGLPDSSSINFENVIKKGIERFKNE